MTIWLCLGGLFGDIGAFMLEDSDVPLCSVSCDASTTSVGCLSVVWRVYISSLLFYNQPLFTANVAGLAGNVIDRQGLFMGFAYCFL
jgi:hypothetical protein